MKRSVIFSVVMMTMMMVSGNSFGQGRGQQMGGQMMSGQRGGKREMVMSNNGDMQMRGREMSNMNRGGGEMRNQPMGGQHEVMGGPVGGPRVDERGFLPGWDGKVRYMDGRWGYLRGGDWYWYDTYYEPDYYFGHPLRVFRGHLSPIGRRIVGGVVGGLILGSILSSF